MPSPFPGMNPYLEQAGVWGNVHAHALPVFVERLVPQVVPAYIVKMEEHVYVHEMANGNQSFLGRADLAVAPDDRQGSHALQEGTIAAPAHVQVPTIDVERLSFIEIRDRESRELITVVELLSPSNKRPGPDRELYLNKRRRILASSTHLVEIDLLRGGPPMPADGRPRCDYAVMVSRAEARPSAEFWPIGLRTRLPIIPVPLRAGDPAARLDLQAVIDHIYDAGGYAYFLYDGEPEPPLRPDDAAWARALLPQLP